MDGISFSAPLQGMRSAAKRFEQASQKLVGAVSGVSDDDPAAAIVEQIEAKLQFKANVQTARAADEMLGSLLDIKV